MHGITTRDCRMNARITEYIVMLTSLALITITCFRHIQSGLTVIMPQISVSLTTVFTLLTRRASRQNPSVVRGRQRAAQIVILSGSNTALVSLSQRPQAARRRLTRDATSDDVAQWLGKGACCLCTPSHRSVRLPAGAWRLLVANKPRLIACAKLADQFL